MTTIDTPEPLPLTSIPNNDVAKVLRNSFNRERGKDEKHWDNACTRALQACPKLIYQYDRLEFSCAKAIGAPNNKLKVVLNPLKMVCYHNKCETPIVTLKHPCNISEYVNHLARHTDKLGDCMFKRFSAMKDDMFFDSYDSISISPYILMKPGPYISAEVTAKMKSYGIKRNLPVIYSLYWKDNFINEGFISTQSLSFQEDDALVEMILQYPNSVQNWSFWRTIATYSLKLFSSISAAAVNLSRGLTYYPQLLRSSGKAPFNPGTLSKSDTLKFIESVNHPSASVTTLQQWLPRVSYENEQYHDKFVRIHQKILLKNKNSLAIKFPKVIRYPVILIIDEQEINQGTFVVDDTLHGMTKKLNASDVREIGLNNLPKYIIDHSPFISSVREYRLTDLTSLYCSNVFTEYISGTLKTDDCEERLKKVAKLSYACESCLEQKIDCSLISISEQCTACSRSKTVCIGLIVIHTLWDMGSSQKSTAQQMKQITKLSNATEMNDPHLFTIAFGGLHLLKASVNHLRNHVLSLNGQNYGVHILRALKNTPGQHSSVLSNLKLAVINGKDRQSDYLSYSTTGPIVQETLKLAKRYICTRVPELILSFNENAKKQPRILFPTAVQTNRNGDVFILDSGASCLHAVDRSSVAKMFLLGEYMKPSNNKVSSKTMMSATSVALSNNLPDLCVPTDRDDIYLVDSGKSEIVIARNVAFASAIRTASINLWRIEDVKSICFYRGNIVCLQQHESDHKVDIFDLDLPPLCKTSPLFVTPKKLKRVKFEEPLKYVYVFSISATLLGLVTAEKEIVFCHNPHGKQCVKKKTDIKTVSKPQVILDGSVAYFPERSRQINHLNVVVSTGKNNQIKFVYSKNTEKDIPETTSCFTYWGSTYQIVSKCSGVYSLTEHGKLDFGLRFSQDINSFYSSISYRPPYGYVSGQKKTFRECVDVAQPLLETLDSMKSERIVKYPSRKQTYGYQGAVFGDTVRCIEDTVSTWEANITRLEFFDSGLVDKVDPHAFTNENLIEHSFGFTKMQGQSQLQSLKEYLHNKLKHEIDFQLKLCNVNFCQKVKVKLRDKSYQHIDEEQKSVLDPSDLWEILGLGRKRSIEDGVESDPNDAKILQHAYLVTKAVPRQSNRAKWKDQSGHAPTMPTVDGAYIDKGDLVFCVDPFNNLKKLLVMEKVEIKENTIVVVSEPEDLVVPTKPTDPSNL